MQTLNNSAEYERNARCIIPIQKRGIIVLASFNQKEIIAEFSNDSKLRCTKRLRYVSSKSLCENYYEKGYFFFTKSNSLK